MKTLIRGGMIYNGTGSTPFVGDIVFEGKVICFVGEKYTGDIDHVIDAKGKMVTPGFVDMHTHYDGQISWDDELAPSVYHGVTTVVLGNCGVGFAPVHASDRSRLIELMEGVEDIPGTALHKGITWDWESFPEYMDALDKKPHTLDFALYVPHDPLRVYVMRERALAEEEATEKDCQEMARLLAEALDAGAIGFATGRSDVHRSSNGEWTPSSEATERELVALGSAFHGRDKGVLQAVNDFNLERGEQDFEEEFRLMDSLARSAQRPMSISLMQRDMAPQQWKKIIASAQESGLPFFFQVAPRGIGTMLGLSGTFHPLMAFPSYIEIADKPLEERVRLLREPQRRARILSESPVRLAKEGSSVPPLVDALFAQLEQVSKKLFALGNPPVYEQPFQESVYGRAMKRGVSPLEYMYDALLEDDGHALLYFPVYNYTEGNFNNVREMMMLPNALPGLSDGGAHVGIICDASFPTYLLSYWTRDRKEGKFPIEWVVQFLTSRPAQFLGLEDRGLLASGMKADINIIDYEALSIDAPRMVCDLPGGSSRLMQKASGFTATFVSGVQVIQDSLLCQSRPGSLIRM
ncbi:MAG: amidohydrolase [Deltaproteobacteria bacterium]|nr:amidohydrolase [Deltaproteobacteria bacterium]